MKKSTYSVVVVRKDSGLRTQMNDTPLSHARAVALASELAVFEWRKVLIETAERGYVRPPYNPAGSTRCHGVPEALTAMAEETEIRQGAIVWALPHPDENTVVIVANRGGKYFIHRARPDGEELSPIMQVGAFSALTMAGVMVDAATGTKNFINGLRNGGAA